MIPRQFLIYMLLLTLTSNLCAMEIIKGKKYKTKDGQIVTIVGDCKEIFGVESVEEIGNAASNPACLAYLTKCIKKSQKTLLLDALGNEISAGNKAVLQACLKPEYLGKFYYAQGICLAECVHPSWLTAIEDEEINEIKKQMESIIGEDWE